MQTATASRRSLRSKYDETGSLLGFVQENRVEIDHISVTVKCLNDDLPGDSRRQRSNGGEDGSFRHFGRLRWQGLKNERMAQILDGRRNSMFR
jgi:hypothetical protein